jgi:hypothetical protein
VKAVGSAAGVEVGHTVRPGDRIPTRAVDVLVPLLLVLIAAAAYRSVVGLWWLFDDFFLLEFVLRHSPGQYWIDRATQGELPHMLTPLLIASIDLDARLFGVDAPAAYLHHLASFLLLVPATYALARRFAGALPAALVTGLIVFGVPVAASVPLLMVRHYVEGLLFAELAALAWVMAVRQRRRSLALVSAVLYGLAASAKEVFVPLPLLLLVIDEGAWRERVRALAPQGSVLAGYLAWRYWMLGTLGGGYGWVVPPEERLAAWVRIPWELARVSAGEAWLAGGALLLVMGVVALGGVRSGRGVAPIAVAAILAGGPLVVVATAIEPRYAMVPWVLLAFGMLPALRRRSPRLIAMVATACALLLALTAIPSWRASMATLERMSAEGRLLSHMAPGDALRGPISPPHALNPLHLHHQVLFGRPSTADWFYDDLYLCDHQPRRIWTWSAPGRTFVEADPAVRRAAAGLCASVPVTAPLEASLRRQGESLSWRLGPYRDGEYAFLLDGGRESYVVPRIGGYRLRFVPELHLRIRYRGPDGHLVYSRPIRLPRGDGAPLDYRQP